MNALAANKYKRMKKKLLLLLFITAVCTGNKVYAQQASLPGYQLLWADEFEAEHYDYSIWTPHRVGAGYINNELQCYTGNTSNIFNRDGNLVLKLIKESSGNCTYTSGKLWTVENKFFLYGLVEARFRLPEGVGTWPAIWMMPKYSTYGAWPRSGEIDIFEWVGFDPYNLYGSALMAGRESGEHTERGIGDLRGSEYEFHTIAFEWTPEYMKWFLDGKLFNDYYKSESNGETRLWPFDQEFYLILNLAYGGEWGGQRGIDDRNLPQEFLIDYVRVYQKTAAGITETEDKPFSVKPLSKETLLVTTESPQTAIDIFSPLGTKQLSINSNTPDTEINIASLPEGIYIITVSDGIHRHTGKFIKE
jgi:beta-glucanase (GH16 family)